MAKASEYWRKRLVRDQALAQREADAVAAEMKREYRLQYAQVVKRLDSLYVEAQRRGELSRTKLWNYLSYLDMEEKLSDMVEGGSMIQRDKLTKTLNRVFEETIGASADRFRREEYVLPFDPRAVIDTAWSGDSFSNRIWKNNERLAEEIRRGCRGIVMGLESPSTIKKRLMRDFDVTKSQAERLVDTETSYVFNKANLMKYQQSGRQKLTIVCLDVNTCDKCKALEGEVFLTMDAPVLPIHPRCHCAYCVPDELEDAEVTMSGGDLEAVYARKGLPGYGDAAQESALGAKLYQPKAARAAEVAKANGMIPASQLQRSVEKAMQETLPEMAEAVGEGARAEGTVSSFGAPSLPTDVGIFGLPTKPEDMGDPVLTMEVGNAEKPDALDNRGLKSAVGDGIIQLGEYGRFVNSKEKLFRYAANIKEIPGFQDYVSHGSPSEFLIYMDADDEGQPDGEEVSYTPKQFADMIRASASYRGGNVRLIACQVGRDDGGAAQQVATLLGVRVMAPTENVHMNSKGEIFISDSDDLAYMWNQGIRIKETGRWRMFEP